MQQLSRDAYRKMIAAETAKPKNKYHAKKTMVGSRKFDSEAEARRYSDLFIRQRRGEISALECQPAYVLTVNGKKICKYIADFKYLERVEGGITRLVIEDVKSKATITPTYRLKKKLFEALHPGLTITEIM